MKILLTLLLSFNLYSQDIIPINKGEMASMDGFLVSEKQMDKFRLINEEKKLLAEKNVQLEDLGVIQEKRIRFFEQDADQYKNQLFKERVSSKFENIMFFVGGVVLTGAISYGLQKTLK